MLYFFELYILFFALYVVVEGILILLNLKEIKQNIGTIPQFAEGFVDGESYEKSCKYSLEKGKFALFSHIYDAGVLLGVLVLGGFGSADELSRMVSTNQYVSGVFLVVFVSLFFMVMGIPLSLYSTFVIEERFGFNKLTFKMWLTDFAKSLALGIAIGVPLLLGVLWFMHSFGDTWWIWAFSFVALIQLVLMFVFPVWIAPIFNKFTPLPEGELKDKIFQMAERAHFNLSGIFLMDGSKRSAHANAYFTGFGKNKRIVLFDTLINTLKTEETVAVLAHEIGHEKCGHIKKTLVLSFFTMFCGFFLLNELLQHLEFYTAFGFSLPSPQAALIVFSYAAAPVTYFLSPLSSMLSRRFEYQADKFASRLVGSGESLRTGLMTLSKKSLSNLTPHPLYSFFHYSHPTLSERIAKL